MLHRPPSSSRLDDLLFGTGGVDQRIEAFPWEATPLGPVAAWPASLRALVAMVLENRFPMTVWWGSDLLHIYNAAYVPVLGEKHPRAFARPAPQVWSEIWDIVGPQCDAVIQGRGATWNEDLMLPMNRRGFVEETYFTFCYSPLRTDDGGLGGVLVTCQDTTISVQFERQQRVLHALAAEPTADSAESTCIRAVRILGAHAVDVPFALIYGADGGDLRLVSATGVEERAVAERIDLDATAVPDARRIAAFATAEREGIAFVEDAWETIGAAYRSIALPMAQRAAIVALSVPGRLRRDAFLVAGVNPLRPLDDRYVTLYRLVANQIMTSLASALAYEEERRRAEELAALDRAKTVFFSNVSHEFRTPLTLMLGPLEEALAAPDTAIAGEQLRLVHRNALRLGKLVNTLLDFARIEAGRIDASFEPVDLARVTAELASVFRSAIERAGLELVVDCAPLAEPVFVDREMWEKIVLNLLSNALKFTIEGRIEVVVRAQDRMAELVVADTGTGIPEAEVPRVFDRFHRVRNARSRTHEGSGIGLALVKELVQLHGGSVELESAVGVGSRFRIRLPFGPQHLPRERIGASRGRVSTATRAEAFVEEALRWLPSGAEQVVTGQATAPLEGGEVPSDRSLRVLVVDDNADMRDYLARLLARHWRVSLASHGGEAVEMAFAAPPDLVLADVMMPVLDGFALVRCLRGDPRTCDVPVVLLSARASEAARIEGLEIGADDYLVKPFSARELVARIHGCLSLARARRDAQDSLRESRERFRVLVEAAAQAVWEADAEGRIVVDSPSWRAYTGQTVQRWMAGAWGDMVHPDDRAAVERAWQKAIASGRAADWEYRLRHVSGDWRWTHMLAAPIRGEDGRVRKWVGMNLDVTERRRAEEALREVDRRKDDFIAMLGHELRNPLAAIRNATDLLGLIDDAAPTLRIVQGVLDRQTAHMTRLVDGLLEVSRIARGKIRLVTEIVDLRDIVAAVAADRAQELHARSLTFERRMPATPVRVLADRVRMTQVIDNLLGNAIKFTDPGGTVGIEVETDVEGSRAMIRVFDTGIGVAPEMQHQLFEPFQQAPQELSRAAGGLGLGLALVKGLVELHGGSVRVHSAGVGHGAEFVVELRATRAEPVTSVPDRDDRVELRRVLIVEDNADAGAALRELLEALGHEVALVTDGPRGVEAVETWRPEIVLCDIGLPGMDGYAVARAVRERSGADGPHMVAVSGYRQAEDRQRARDAGFDAHLTKPVSRRQIDTVLQRFGAR